MVVNKSCVAAYLGGWPDGRGLSGRMRVERVAGSPWNRWPDAHGMGGRMAVESALPAGIAIGAIAAAATAGHKLATYNPDYEVLKDYVNKKLTVTYKK